MGYYVSLSNAQMVARIAHIRVGDAMSGMGAPVLVGWSLVGITLNQVREIRQAMTTIREEYTHVHRLLRPLIPKVRETG